MQTEPLGEQLPINSSEIQPTDHYKSSDLKSKEEETTKEDNKATTAAEVGASFASEMAMSQSARRESIVLPAVVNAPPPPKTDVTCLSSAADSISAGIGECLKMEIRKDALKLFMLVLLNLTTVFAQFIFKYL